MAGISAADVAKLRNITGAGMMDCKEALGQSNGNFDENTSYYCLTCRKKAPKTAHL